MSTYENVNVPMIQLRSELVNEKTLNAHSIRIGKLGTGTNNISYAHIYRRKEKTSP